MAGAAAATAFLAGVTAVDMHLVAPVGLLMVVVALLLRGTAAMPTWAALVVGAAFGAGVFCAAHSRPWMPNVTVLQQARQFEGIVVSIPQTYPTRTQAEVMLDTPVAATVTAVFPPDMTVEQGMRLALVGTVHRVARPLATGRQTALVLTVQSMRVTGVVASAPVRLRTQFQHAVRARILSAVPEPAGSLTLGVLTGDDALMPPSTRTVFQQAGLSHLTAVSGWNLSVIAGVIEAGLGWRVSSRWRGMLTLGALWGYAYLVGLEPSVLRAAALATLSILGQLRGNPRAPILLVLWATDGLLLWNPLLRFDPGFQLSVIATMTLVGIQPLVQASSRWMQAVFVAGAVQAAVIPATLYWFGQVSLVAPLANVLVEPIVPLVMAGGAVTVAATTLHPLLGRLAGMAPWLAGRLVETIASWCIRLPGAGLIVPAPPAAPVVLLYGAALIALLWHQFGRHTLSTPSPTP